MRLAPGQFAQAPAPNYQELWANDGSVPPPIDRAALKPPKARSSNNPDFLDWAADVPDAAPGDNPFGEPALAQQPHTPCRSEPLPGCAGGCR